MKEVNDVAIRALVAALGKEDAQRFFSQFAGERVRSTEAATESADELPPLTIEQAHEAIRDMHDPMAQQHML